jgi:hypothetical protein
VILGVRSGLDWAWGRLVSIFHVSQKSACPMRSASIQPFIYRGQRSAAHTQEVTPTIYRESPVKGSVDRRRYSGITMKKPALIAVPFIESQWLRYVIQDERERYWTGKGFSNNQRQALTYADSLAVTQDMRRILRRRCKGLVRYRFVVPVMIDVYANGPIDQEEMAWFLSQNCLVSMSRLGTGEGPGDSVVLPLVDWNKMKMLKGGSGRERD